MAFEIEKIAEFIGHNQGVWSYLHNTGEEQTARKAMGEGFRFFDCLHKTTDRIQDAHDHLVLNVWNARRKVYGPHTIIVQIDGGLFEKYGGGKMLGEHALSLDRFYDDEEEGYVYTLQPQFVKGYFNRNTNEGYLNPNFNPSYDNPELAKLNAGRFLDF